MITKEEAVKLSSEPRWFAEVRRAAWNGKWFTTVELVDQAEAKQAMEELRAQGFNVSLSTITEFYNASYSLTISWNET